ncbi:hypothetical protein K0M31_000532 [Melipona bicolor]|uniref:Uncharacterized protein n=1 Tax=Melipona bicolor TaxID=60889 RepID=A0AA40GDR6_9HYME|nr:hypothetical protein K0M31_000532 [Melipona bicolor]
MKPTFFRSVGRARERERESLTRGDSSPKRRKRRKEEKARRNGFLGDLRGSSWNWLGSGRRDDDRRVPILRGETEREILEQFGSLAGSTWHEETGRTTERLLGALSRRVLLPRAQLLAEAAEELLCGAD